MPKRKARFNNSTFEEREFDETVALDKLQVLARAIKSSQLSLDEYVYLTHFVAGKPLDLSGQTAFREALRKTLAWVFKLIRMEYQGDPAKKIMTSVLSTQIQDYIYGKRLCGSSISKELKATIKDTTVPAKARSNRILGLRRAEQAYVYIFDDSTESDEYVFGFKFVCRHLGLDPKRLRVGIKKRAETQDLVGLEDLVNIS